MVSKGPRYMLALHRVVSVVYAGFMLPQRSQGADLKMVCDEIAQE